MGRVRLWAVSMVWAAAAALSAGPAQAHCQIPCGIYDDARVFDELEEHVRTIERSVRGIAEAQSVHDAARWTLNKETHAQLIQDRAQDYFLAQRVTPVSPRARGFGDYLTSLRLLHEMIVAAMGAKQSADPAPAARLKSAVEAYRAHYFKLHGHRHGEGE